MTHPQVDDNPELSGLLAWRQRYLNALRDPRGWWSVVGLAWLKETGMELGRSNPELGLPDSAPHRFARVSRNGEGAQLETLGGTQLWLDGTPVEAGAVAVGDMNVLTLGPEPEALAMVFLRRGERFGVRVFDPGRGANRDPAQLAWFPPDSQWRLTATWEPAEVGETLPIVNLLGDVSEAPVAGRLHLHHGGGTNALIARPKPGGLLLHFRDATSDRPTEAGGTYGAGRFLHVDPPVDGQVVVDFNRCYHPPCAHTEHATCPLPPLGNRLPYPVTAGERLPEALVVPGAASEARTR